MSAKHTPGPWFIGERYRDDEGFPELPIHADVPGHARGTITPAAVCLQFPDGGEMQFANARLIAAAPDYDSAAETMLGSAVDCGTYFKVDRDDIEAFRATLAKARGEA